jgi:hypothetical protein
MRWFGDVPIRESGDLEATEMSRFVLAMALAMAASPAFAQTAALPAAADPHAGHAMEPAQQTAPAATAPRNPNLPPTGDIPGDNKNAVAIAQLKRRRARASGWTSRAVTAPR